MEPRNRPRRLRTDGVRPLVSETELAPTDLVAPVFVDATTDERVEIETMPGHERVPIAESVDRVEEITETGIEAVIVFGIPESKDETGTRAWADNGVVQQAVRRITAETDAYVITDVCLCEYTDHGHCGVLEAGAESDPRLTVDNDATLELLDRIAVSHAEAGADMVAPSGMMDGMVGAIRDGLDREATGTCRSCPTPPNTSRPSTGRFGTPPTGPPRSVIAGIIRWTPRTRARHGGRSPWTSRRARTC